MFLKSNCAVRLDAACPPSGSPRVDGAASDEAGVAAFFVDAAVANVSIVDAVIMRHHVDLV